MNFILADDWLGVFSVPYLSVTCPGLGASPLASTVAIASLFAIDGTMTRAAFHAANLFPDQSDRWMVICHARALDWIGLEARGRCKPAKQARCYYPSAWRDWNNLEHTAKHVWR
jgi:hypothetical protein